MKNVKTKKVALLTGVLSSLVLVACGGGGGETSKTSKTSSATSKTSSVATSSVAPVEEHISVTYKVEGQQDVVQDVLYGDPLVKPADPAAPQGKAFYGWKNLNNGGQIWDYEDENLNHARMDMVFEPMFIDPAIQPQFIEAELSPTITYPTFMPGATYSGGQQGKGLIGKESLDSETYLGSTTIKSFDYIEYNYLKEGEYTRTRDKDIVAGKKYFTKDGDTYTEVKNPVKDDIKSYYEYKSVAGICNTFEEDTLPANANKTPKHVDSDFGAFVHFMYKKGDTLHFEVEVDKAVENVIMFARYSAEYGLEDSHDVVECSFNENSFPITVNGEKMKYGTVKISNIIPKDYIKFQDFLVGTNIKLKQGTNIIEMIVDNNDTLNGTIESTAPVIDSLKLYTDAAITWPGAYVTNLIDD